MPSSFSLHRHATPACSGLSENMLHKRAGNCSRARNDRRCERKCSAVRAASPPRKSQMRTWSSGSSGDVISADLFCMVGKTLCPSGAIQKSKTFIKVTVAYIWRFRAAWPVVFPLAHPKQKRHASQGDAFFLPKKRPNTIDSVFQRTVTLYVTRQLSDTLNRCKAAHPFPRSEVRHVELSLHQE